MALAPALFVAGTALSVGSGLVQADATYRAGRQQARDAEIEAQLTEAATRQADREAREQIRRQRIADRTFRGRQRAAIAAGGVVTSTGSPIDILGRTAALQELAIQDQARAAATQYTRGLAQARQIRVGGRAALSGAKAASLGGIVGTVGRAATSVVGGFDQGIFGNRSLLPA